MSASKDRNARFAGRRVYVTGAASGIGLAAAKLLVEGGAKVALVDMNVERLQAAAAETGGVPIAVDLRDGAAVDASVVQAVEALGGLDGIVNSAGVAHGGLVHELDPEDWARVLAVNLTAPYRICRAAVPYMKREARGSIVNIASGAGIRPIAPGSSAYSASKGGLISLTRALSIELAPTIRVNTVSPGVVDTPMNAHILNSERADAFVAQYALKRVAEPVELAEAIGWLISDEASFVTGVVLVVDGGRIFY